MSSKHAGNKVNYIEIWKILVIHHFKVREETRRISIKSIRTNLKQVRVNLVQICPPKSPIFGRKSAIFKLSLAGPKIAGKNII